MELGVALIAWKCSELAFYVHLHYGISFFVATVCWSIMLSSALYKWVMG